MVKCKQERSHINLWRIKKKIGNRITIYCLVCNWEWESTSDRYNNLPRLTEVEKENHLIGKYD